MKRSRGLASLSLLLVAAACPAHGAEDPASHVAGLVGSWTCQGASTTATQLYTRRDDTSLALKNQVRRESGAPAEFDDTFRFDAAAKRWSWESVSLEDSGLTQSGTANDWTSDTWTFDGTVRKFQAPERGTANGRMVRQDDLRVTYTFIDDSSFRRVFAVAAGDAWKTVSDTTCTRETKP